MSADARTPGIASLSSFVTLLENTSPGCQPQFASWLPFAEDLHGPAVEFACSALRRWTNLQSVELATLQDASDADQARLLAAIPASVRRLLVCLTGTHVEPNEGAWAAAFAGLLLRAQNLRELQMLVEHADAQIGTVMSALPAGLVGQQLTALSLCCTAFPVGFLASLASLVSSNLEQLALAALALEDSTRETSSVHLVPELCTLLARLPRLRDLSLVFFPSILMGEGADDGMATTRQLAAALVKCAALEQFVWLGSVQEKATMHALFDPLLPRLKTCVLASRYYPEEVFLNAPQSFAKLEKLCIPLGKSLDHIEFSSIVRGAPNLRHLYIEMEDCVRHLAEDTLSVLAELPHLQSLDLLVQLTWADTLRVLTVAESELPHLRHLGLGVYYEAEFPADDDAPPSPLVPLPSSVTSLRLSASVATCAALDLSTVETLTIVFGGSLRPFDPASDADDAELNAEFAQRGDKDSAMLLAALQRSGVHSLSLHSPYVHFQAAVLDFARIRALRVLHMTHCAARLLSKPIHPATGSVQLSLGEAPMPLLAFGMDAQLPLMEFFVQASRALMRVKLSDAESGLKNMERMDSGSEDGEDKEDQGLGQDKKARSLLARLLQVRRHNEKAVERDARNAVQHGYSVARQLDLLEFRLALMAVCVQLLRAGVPRDVRRIIIRRAVHQSRFPFLLA